MCYAAAGSTIPRPIEIGFSDDEHGAIMAHMYVCAVEKYIYQHTELEVMKSSRVLLKHALLTKGLTLFEFQKSLIKLNVS